jgi:hypothetical protein
MINAPSDQPFGPSSQLVYLEKTDPSGVSPDGKLTLTGGPVGQGTWSFTPISGYTNFVLLLEQSANPNKTPDWAAFVLDALNGTWSIFGSNDPNKKAPVFNLETLSHAILYGELSTTPLPGTLVLFASGICMLMGFSWLRRARRGSGFASGRSLNAA